MFQNLNTSLVFNSPQNILHIVFGIEFAYKYITSRKIIYSISIDG